MEEKIVVTDEKENKGIDQLVNTILIFFFVSWVGWNFEILWCFISDGVLANRGALIGPWVPIYGYSCVFIISLLYNKKIMKNKFGVFLLIMLICTIIEYATSIYLEKMHNLRWWDYSSYKFNFQGRISLETSLLFGVAGMLGLYKVIPDLLDRLKRFPQQSRKTIAIVLFIIFLIDNVYCTFKPHIGNQTITEATNTATIEKDKSKQK